MAPEQLDDVLENGVPEENFKAVIEHWRNRANQANEIAADLRRDAQDANERAAEFREAARDFEAMAYALENASITFPGPASGTEARRAETENTDSVHDGPTSEAGDAQNTPGEQA